MATSARLVCVLLVSVLVALPQLSSADICSARNVNATVFVVDSPFVFGPVFIDPPNYSTVVACSLAGFVYRSLDFGRTWDVVNFTGISPGASPAVVKLYIGKDEKTVIAVATLYLGNRPSMLWISTDGAATFSADHPTPGAFYNLEIHPTKPNLVLGQHYNCSSGPGSPCSEDLYLSQDTGATWSLIRTYVWEALWFTPQAFDGFKDTIYIYDKVNKTIPMDQDVFARNDLYRSTDLFQTPMQLLYTSIDGVGLKKDKLFVSLHDQNPPVIGRVLVSEDHGATFSTMRFPPALEQSQYTVLDFAAQTSLMLVARPGRNNAGIYVSPDLDFSLALKNVPRENVDGGTEVIPVMNLDGIYIAQRFVDVVGTGNGTIRQSYISYNKGASWTRLPLPTGVSCTNASCGLNFDYKLSLAGLKDTVGMSMALGNTEADLAPIQPWAYRSYFTRDAGHTWDQVPDVVGAYQYASLAHGSVILGTMTPNVAPVVLPYSLDQGLTWENCTVPSVYNSSQVAQVGINYIVASPNPASKSFILGGNNYGSQFPSDYKNVYFIDFAPLNLPTCAGINTPGTSGSDYEYFTPSDTQGGQCFLGRTTRYVRRKRDSLCWDTAPAPAPVVISNCSCTINDYACDWCFYRDETNSSACLPDPDCPGFDPTFEPVPCVNTWKQTRGYRLVDGSTCDLTTGLNLLPVTRPCGVAVPPTPTPTPMIVVTSSPRPSTTPTPTPVEEASAFHPYHTLFAMCLGALLSLPLFK